MGRLYFAYGADINKNHLLSICPKTSPLGPHYLKDFDIAFVGISSRWRGGTITLVKKPGSSVQGILYRISPEEERLLDSYQGVPRNNRKKLIGKLEDDDLFTYISSSTTPHKPSQAYLQMIKEGYEEWGLDLSALKKHL